MSSEERIGARAHLVEQVASRVAARLRPGYTTEQRKRGAAGRSPVPWEDRYETVEVPPGTANDDTMVVFTAEDGGKSIRALTWREATFEVIGEVLPLLTAADVPGWAEAEAKIAAARRYLGWVCPPSMGLPGGADPVAFARCGATEHNARMALALCIENIASARAALAAPADGSEATP